MADQSKSVVITVVDEIEIEPPPVMVAPIETCCEGCCASSRTGTSCA